MLNNFEGGFYVQNVDGTRKPCLAAETFRAACEAGESFIVRTDFYLSMFTFLAEFVQRIKETGKTAGYEGPCWSDYLWFDIDCAGFLSRSLDNTRLLVTWLVEQGVNHESIQVWFSGAKGFHIGVPIMVFGPTVTATLDFVDRCKAVAMEIARRAEVKIDPNVYKRVQPFRCPNTRHGKTGLYKVPLSWGELSDPSTDIAWIRNLAEQPRPLIDVSVSQSPQRDHVLFRPTSSAIITLAEIWQNAEQYMSAVGQIQAWAPQSQTFPGGDQRFPRLRRDSLEFILEGVPEGERATRLFMTTADCVRSGWPEGAIYSLLPDAGRRTGLHITEIQKQIEAGIAAETRKEESHVE